MPKLQYLSSQAVQTGRLATLRDAQVAHSVFKLGITTAPHTDLFTAFDHLKL